MFKTANHIEAGLWIVIGIVFAVCAMMNSRVRVRAFAAAIVFILFGASDIVEAQLGAWWKTWWLISWKALCILSMIILFVRHKLGRLATENLEDTSTSFARIDNPVTSAIEIDLDLSCNACGYNLRGLTAGGKCPECGCTIKSTIAAMNAFRIRGEYLLIASYVAYWVLLIWSFQTDAILGDWLGKDTIIWIGLVTPTFLALAAIVMLILGPATRVIWTLAYIIALAITATLYVLIAYVAINSV
ncbi:MAG: hypothetical protein DHS20C16_30320 [Phycisphaerae bacterium]|nr:MAG: hypothetical protein DHS20C16_30320 [Phycisphaerae bacterium]